MLRLFYAPHTCSLASHIALEEAGAEFEADTLLDAFEDADFEKMDAIRSRVDAIVDDPRTAEGLKAWYGQLCKRPCFHDEYLPAFNRPGVTLVDMVSVGSGVVTGKVKPCPRSRYFVSSGRKWQPMQVPPNIRRAAICVAVRFEPGAV